MTVVKQQSFHQMNHVNDTARGGETLVSTKAAKTSPQFLARVAGLLYLIAIIAGITAQMAISGKLVVAGDAASTATNILAHKELFQLGFTVYLIEMVCQIAQTSLFYFLLKPVNGNVALLALVFSLIGCTIKVLGRLFYIAPLLILGNNPYLSVFGAEQQQALALLLLNVNDQATGMAVAFFGFSTCLNGYLVFRSGYLPRFLGIVSVMGGLGWLTFLYPPLGLQLYPYILLIAMIGSLSSILWLLIKGVNIEKWKTREIESA